MDETKTQWAPSVGARPGTPDVYRAINAVTKALSRDGITKDKQNTQQGYKFRGIDDVYNALSATLAGAELCMLPRMMSRTVTERETAKGGTLFYVIVEAEFDLVSSRDGSSHTVKTFGEAMDSGDKATNKAMSAAFKYMAMQTFCIPTEGMDDADQTTHEVKAPSKAATPQQMRETAQARAIPHPAANLVTPAPAKGAMQSIGAVAASAQATKDAAKMALNKLLQKFMDAGVPQEFKKILGVHGYQLIDDAVVGCTYEQAKALIEDLNQVFKDLKARAV